MKPYKGYLKFSWWDAIDRTLFGGGGVCWNCNWPLRKDEHPCPICGAPNSSGAKAVVGLTKMAAHMAVGAEILRASDNKEAKP